MAGKQELGLYFTIVQLEPVKACQALERGLEREAGQKGQQNRRDQEPRIGEMSEAE